MDFSLIGVRLLVDDFGKCYDFYTKKLGLDVFWGDRKGPYTAFCVPGDDQPCLSIFLAKNQAMYKGYIPLGGPGKSDQATLVLPSDSVDGDYAALKKKGVEFMGEPQTIHEWSMRCVYFRDPEGNMFELCEEIE